MRIAGKVRCTVSIRIRFRVKVSERVAISKEYGQDDGKKVRVGAW